MRKFVIFWPKFPARDYETQIRIIYRNSNLKRKTFFLGGLMFVTENETKNISVGFSWIIFV